ncbi:MAG: hypothetical protein DI528_18555 [Shinella sp.]|nr:MAG: hypothetical protein DI528_18555 [Shinella sp.]
MKPDRLLAGWHGRCCQFLDQAEPAAFVDFRVVDLEARDGVAWVCQRDRVAVLDHVRVAVIEGFQGFIPRKVAMPRAIFWTNVTLLILWWKSISSAGLANSSASP